MLDASHVLCLSLTCSMERTCLRLRLGLGLTLGLTLGLRLGLTLGLTLGLRLGLGLGLRGGVRLAPYGELSCSGTSPESSPASGSVRGGQGCRGVAPPKRPLSAVSASRRYPHTQG